MRQYIIMYVDTLGIERALHFEEASTNHLSIEYVTNNEVVLRNQHTAVIPFFGVGGWKYELKRRKSNTKVKKKVRKYLMKTYPGVFTADTLPCVLVSKKGQFFGS